MTPTYYGTDPAANAAFVTGALAGGVPPAAVGVGVGSMLSPGTAPPPKWDYNWTAPGLRSLLGWLPSVGVRRVDVWRADIDEYGTTAPWLPAALAEWLAGG